MSSYPNIKQDANGNYYVEGIKERDITQQELDYNELLQASQKITGPEGVIARDTIRNNPNASAGIISGLYKSGAIGDSKLVQTMLEIDKYTQDKRAEDQFKEAQRIADENFSKTPWGVVWKAIKGTTRGGFTTLFTPLEYLLNQSRAVVANTFDTVKDIKNGQFNFWDFNDPESINLLKKTANPVNNLEQLSLYQAVKQLATEGKIDTGSGFFFSEETGAGFRARQKQMEVGKVLVKRDGEQIVDENGAPLYRPYSPLDPISFILTGGHIEDGNARFINAIGELGLMVAFDPTTAWAKAARESKALKEAVTVSKGIKDAKRILILDNKIAEASARTDESLAALQTGYTKEGLSKFTAAEREKIYKDALETELKLRDYKTSGFNYDSIATFISGEKGSHIVDAIANIDDWQVIRAISKRGGKEGFTVDQAIALASAKNREEVLAAIAPYIANGSVTLNMLETGNVTSRFLSRISKGSTATVAQGIKGWAAKGIKKQPFIQKQLTELSKTYNTYVPTQGSFVHYADKDSLVDIITGYGRLTGLDEQTISKIVNDIAFAKDPSVAGFKASTDLFDTIFKANEAAFAKAGIDSSKLKELTRVFDADRKAQSSYWAELHASGANIDFIIDGGKKVTLSGPHLDSEFLNSMIYFPPPKELISEIAKLSKLNKATKGAYGKAFDAADAFTSNFWKKVILVRPAYVIRNISEEQIRVMFTGHSSFFNNPLAALAMWQGRSEGPKWKQMLNSFDQYKNTATGKDFKLSNSAQELLNESLAHSNSFDYLDFMATQAFGASSEIGKISQFRGYKNVQYGEPLFWDAIANEIRILSNSPIAKAVARSIPGQEANTVDYFLKGAGKEAWNRFANARSPEIKQWLLTPQGARTYLFDGVTDTGRAASLRARIEEVAGQGGEASDAIRNLINNGTISAAGITLKVPTAEDSAINSIKNARQISKNRKAIRDANEVFARQLKDVFDGKGNWAGIRFKVSDPSVVVTKANKSRVNDIVDKFFDTAIRFEKTTTMGPEWRMTYWDAVGSLALSADTNAIRLIKQNAPKNLASIVSPTGKPIGRQHPIWNILKSADGFGPLTIDEIHEFAARAASRHVKDLFYNASKKRLLWHQLRLIAPFGQAWSDTITKWGKLALDNPDQVYKIGRGLNWIQSPESSALYQVTDAKDYYDPNQGFFFTDPQSGQRQFFIPFMSTGMNFFSNLFRGQFTNKGAFATAANPQSFNFALGSGTVLPGVGPGLSLGLNVLDGLGKNPIDLLPAVWKNDAYKFIYPFGQPDLSTTYGAVSTVTSNNIGRVIAGLTGSQESYAASFAPVMNYLATGGDYNIDDMQDQARLIKDTNDFAKWFMIMRGIFGFASPVAVQPKDLTRDSTGNAMLASALYSDFRKIEQESGSNRNAAYAKFLDLYGPEQVFAIISSTSGGPTNLFTYQLIMKDPSVLDKYPDVYGYIYPNGGFSQELYRWQQRNNMREKLSAEEIMKKATRVRYYAAKDRLLARSVSEGWDSKRLAAANSSLADSYDVKNLNITYDASKEDRILAQLNSVAYDERFADSNAVTGLRDYLLLRDKAIKASGQKTLNNKASLSQREWLAERALEIIQRNPDFQKIYYSFFKKELEG